jgi:aromatic ring-cleaving dioxygenase
MAELHGYHAHIYYGDDSRSALADEVCKDLAASFSVELGKNNGIAGPHPIAQRQVIFRTSTITPLMRCGSVIQFH